MLGLAYPNSIQNEPKRATKTVHFIPMVNLKVSNSVSQEIGVKRINRLARQCRTQIGRNENLVSLNNIINQ